MAYEQIYIEAVGGVAGDMLLGALIDLGAEPAPLVAAMQHLNLPGLHFASQRVQRQGVAALHVKSLAPAPITGHRATQHHDHAHHAHVHLHDILDLIERAPVDAAVRQTSAHIFTLLAQAEASVHGGDAHGVHLHEVGEVDSVLDVLGASLMFHQLGRPRVVCAPLPSGVGQVQTSHGLLQCPVPAVQALCERFAVPLEPVDVSFETITPTGVAILVGLGAHFERCDDARVGPCGVGAGTRDLAGCPNVVRIYGRKRRND